MKHKVNKKVFRRTLSLVLVLAMLVTGFNLDVKVESVYATQKAEKTEDNGEIKDYIIVAKNEKAYNRALNATGEEAIKKSNPLGFPVLVLILNQFWCKLQML